MFRNPTIAARMMAVCCVVLTSLWVSGVHKRGWWRLPLLVAAVLLVMTRTRASIAAAAFGVSAVAFTAALGQLRHISANGKKAIAACVFAASIGIFVLWYGVIKEAQAVTYLRLEGGANEIYKARAHVWKRGIRDFLPNGLFGKGLLAKFGNTRRCITVMGIRFPTYDWTSTADPLNMFLSSCDQMGIPGAFFLLLLLLALWRARHGLNIQGRYVVIGLMCTGMIFGGLDGNWLTSFGDPVDRLCMFAFAAIISCPVEAEARAEEDCDESQQHACTCAEAPAGYGIYHFGRSSGAPEC